ncbi:hypothetical protein ACPPVO_15395 [Dactylosporangium sp. McL0621]|uniref:hypothetical protein n=1 Tax=Dactylosporangium sp. McL0621 TaxID=3415678 RepID=UPI003CED47CB
MRINGSIALVGGLGRLFARQLLERCAAKVYATARDPERIDVPGVERLRRGITDPGQVAAVAAVAPDVTLLVNNAGISTWTDPAAVVRAGLDGLEAGRVEVPADAWSAHVKASLAAGPREFYTSV